MFKKLTLVALSVAALVAFAVPAAAQAEGPLITNSLEGAAESITAESTNTNTVTSNGTLECATVTLSVSLTENAKTTAHGHGTGTAKGTRGKTPHSSHCGTSVGIQVHITNITVGTIHLTKHSGQTTGTANFSYTYILTHPTLGEIECTFGGTGIPVTAINSDTIEVKGEVTKTGGGALCASTGQLSGTFTVRDEFGEPAVIH